MQSIDRAKPLVLGVRIAIMTMALLVTCSRTYAQPQTDLVAPTGWFWYYNVPLQTVIDKVNQGFRVVDIEIENDNPLRVSAALVRNTGDYAKGWWWYVGLTEAQVNSFLSANNARLIDIEPYDAGGSLRFAAVMISNTGFDQASHGWLFGQTFTNLSNYLAANPSVRFLDIQPYVFGGVRRWAVVLISNTGNQATPWAWFANTSIATISNYISANNVRLIDLEEQSNGNYSAVLVPNDGNSWWYLYAVTPATLSSFVDQYNARIIDIQYRGGLVYAVMRRNANNLSNSVNLGMRGRTDGTSGFLLRELGGSTLANMQEWKVFEPASTMKTTHHLHAMRQVALGNDNLANFVTVFTGLTGSCPNFSSPQSFTLQATLKQMMEQSSNAHTAAIQDRFGVGPILATALSQGMVDTNINHRLGCLCGNTRNEITLNDLYSLHRSVDAGYVDPFRAEFYDFMVNSLSSNGMGGFSFQQVLDQELAASILFPSAQASFSSGVYAAAKGGSYTCNAGPEFHRTYAGYVRLPFLSSRCGSATREFFMGAWVNDATTAANANGATGYGYTEIFRDRVRAAINTWEASPCHCPVDLTTTDTNPGDPGHGQPDGRVNGADLSFYVEQWFLATQKGCLPCYATADVTRTNTNPGDPGYGVPDNAVNGSDISFYVEAWLAGCS